MNDAERQAFRDDSIIPAGWVWCPDCNGEGVITRMSVAFPHEETTYTCDRCAAEHGIVPAEDVPWFRSRAGDLEVGDEIQWDGEVRVVVDYKPAREGLGVTYVVQVGDDFAEYTYWLDEMIYARVPIRRP